ncbi:MAG: TolC family protein [Bacteroidales bacterium]
MKTCSSLVRTTVVAAVVVLLSSTTGMLAQQKGKSTVSDERVAELMKMALEQAVQQAKPGAPAAPQGPVVDLQIEDAVNRAAEQNIDLSVAKLNPQLQDLSLAQTRAAYKPTLTGTFGDNSRTSIPSDTLSGGAITTTQNYTYNAGISQVLPWTGGTAAFNWNNGRQFLASNNYRINPSYSSSFQLQLTQDLWRNFTIDATRQSLWTGLIQRQITDVNLRATIVNTVASTRNAYWDLVYAIQALEVARQSLTLSEKLVQDNQARVEIGTLAPLDVITAQSQAATARQTVVQREQTVKQNEITLKRLIVASTTDPLWSATLNPVDRPEPPAAAAPIDLESAIRNALDKRTDLIVSRETLRQSEITLKYNKNQTAPRAQLVANYGASGTGGDIWSRIDPTTGKPTNTGGVVTLAQAGGYTDALRIMSQRQAPAWSAQVNFSYQIGTSSQDAAYARAKVQLQQSQMQLKKQELQVATDVTNAALNVQNYLQQVATTRVARELAQKKLEAEQSKFDVGMQTNYFVTQAQNDLLNAQTAELQAIANYRKALVTFQQVQETGSGSVSGVSSGGTGGTGGTGSTGGGA